MRVAVVKLPYRTVFLEPLGDFHVGNPGFDEEKLRERIRAIKRQRNRFTIGMGDYAEWIYPSPGGITDKRWSPQHVRRDLLTRSDQYDYVLKLLRPLRGKVLGLLSGNHEWVIEDYTGIELTRYLAEELETKYLGAAGLIQLWLKGLDDPIVIAATHGSYAGRTLGGAMNRLNSWAKGFDADIYLMGHTHWRHVWEGDEKITVSRDGKLIRYHPVKALTGSFLHGYVQGGDSYVERKALPPRKIGTITVKIEVDDEGNVKLRGFQ